MSTTIEVFVPLDSGVTISDDAEINTDGVLLLGGEEIGKIVEARPSVSGDGLLVLCEIEKGNMSRVLQTIATPGDFSVGETDASRE